MEFKDKFPDCEVGAMPPFGSLYDLQTYISPELLTVDEIAFNAGTHYEVIKLNTFDFFDLTESNEIDFTKKILL